MRKKNGFTLTEMLIVMALIIILATMVLINYRTGQKQLTLQRAANKLAQDIRRAQEMAMAAENQSSQCSAPQNFNYTFGLSFSTQTNCSNLFEACKYRYILFADCNGNYTYQWNPDADFRLELIDFLDVQIAALGSFSKDIAFKPPDPTLFVDGNTNTAQVSIVISLRSDPTKTKTIIINKAGMVEIQ